MIRAFEEEVSFAGVAVAAFAALVAVSFAVAPPTPAQLAAADPLVQAVVHWLGIWAVPVVSLVVPITWWCVARPTQALGRRAVTHVAAAFAAVSIGLPVLRLIVGPVFPDAIPPEESARPGMAFGLCAALLEEGVFRLGLLAPIYVVLARASGRRVVAGAVAIVVSALVVTLAHEVGPGATPVWGQYFAARFVVLGCFMGVLSLRPGPVFLVAGHCAAHVWIPLLFSGIAP